MVEKRSAPQHRRGERRLQGPVLYGVMAGILVVVIAVTAVVVSLATSGGDDRTKDKPQAAEESSVPSDNPLHGREFYVNPTNPAAEQAREWQNEGRTEEAAQVRKIAERPIAEWFGNGSGDVRQEAAELVADAKAAGQSALLVAYYVPHRDCGQYSSGGAPDAVSYRTWIAQLAAGLAGGPATVILEPDAIAHTIDGCIEGDAVAERYTLLREAIVTLKKNPKTVVYVDAGNASWIKDLDGMIAALKHVGIDKADGFALNVSNFETTDASVDYGTKLSDELAGAHYVIDTSRNGNGAYTEASDENRWCNPPGRALGTPPTTDTGLARVDAFLWVKQPGDSDGACRDGAPGAGEWWPDYALALARATK